jgi:hypothetical protein
MKLDNDKNALNALLIAIKKCIDPQIGLKFLKVENFRGPVQFDNQSLLVLAKCLFRAERLHFNLFRDLSGVNAKRMLTLLIMTLREAKPLPGSKRTSLEELVIKELIRTQEDGK